VATLSRSFVEARDWVHTRWYRFIPESLDVDERGASSPGIRDLVRHAVERLLGRRDRAAQPS
jgi:hypothetical protein